MAILPLFCTDMPRKLRFYQPKQRKDDRVLPQPAPLSEKAEFPSPPFVYPCPSHCLCTCQQNCQTSRAIPEPLPLRDLKVCNCLTLTCIIQFNIMFPNSGCGSLSLATSTSGRLVWQHERASLKWKRMNAAEPGDTQGTKDDEYV